MKFSKKLFMGGLVTALIFSATACGGGDKAPSGEGGDANAQQLPKINEIAVGTDYKDINAEIKVLTNRTDIVDTVYKGYADEFMKIYPNIKVQYEAITDYEEALQLRLPNGDWGDICFIPTTVDKNELENFFIPLGDVSELDNIYNFGVTSQYDGKQYGIANGGTASGIVYNKRIWEEAGITEKPKTPEEFLECLKQIKEKTDSIPLYTNFAAGWTMGQWDSYIGINATGNQDYKNITICHEKDPFRKKDDFTGPYAVYYTLYEAVARGLIEEDPASTDWESSKTRINNGEIATMLLGSWAVNQCKEKGDTPEDVFYMPFPITVNGKQYAESGGNYSYGINSKTSSDNQIASMIYVKWLVEESPMFTDEGSIPALKSEPLPDVLSDFANVELLSDNPSRPGEETLFNDINSESEIGINKNDYTKSEILEAALYKTKTLDEIMAQWNQKWSSAQEKLNVEIE